MHCYRSPINRGRAEDYGRLRTEATDAQAQR
jgi:hypothetical protein